MGPSLRSSTIKTPILCMNRLTPVHSKRQHTTNLLFPVKLTPCDILRKEYVSRPTLRFVTSRLDDDSFEKNDTPVSFERTRPYLGQFFVSTVSVSNEKETKKMQSDPDEYTHTLQAKFDVVCFQNRMSETTFLIMKVLQMCKIVLHSTCFLCKFVLCDFEF